MNTPNKLTVLRMVLIPVFLVFLLPVWQGFAHQYLLAVIVFAAASLTDLLDGHLARKYNLITDFGKFMDPLADKLLVMSAMVGFVELGWAPALVVIIILAREFLVTSLRLIAAGSGKVLAADKWGKYKTVSQMVWICYLLLAQWGLSAGLLPVGWAGGIQWGNMGLMVLVTALTLYSGWNYLWNNRQFVNTAK